MKYHGMEVSFEKYCEILKRASIIVKQVAYFYNKDLKDINCHDIQSYFERMGIQYAGYPLSENSKMVGGVIIKNENGVIIGYNSSPNIIKEKQNTTQLKCMRHIIMLNIYRLELFFSIIQQFWNMHPTHQRKK